MLKTTENTEAAFAGTEGVGNESLRMFKRQEVPAQHVWPIFSPGSLPNSMTLDELSERQFSRNELICSSGKRPVYSLIDESELKLTLYSAPGDSPVELSRIAQRLTENEISLNQRLKMLMRENPAITQHQLAGVCAVSRSAVAMAIKGLKESGEVSRQGSDRKGTWIVY